jgi:hypothetical protein
MKTNMKYRIKSLPIGLSFVIIFQFAAARAQAQNPPLELNIVVMEGEGATNPVRQRVSPEPAIRVEDENHKPLAGAAVVFTLPTEGATGEFGNGSKSLTVVTDSQGRATAQGLRVNQIPGKVPIHVNASYRGLTARASITQYNEGPAVAVKSGGGNGKMKAILAAVGVAAASGAALAITRTSGTTSSSSTNNPAPTAAIGITPGAGSIVGPH